MKYFFDKKLLFCLQILSFIKQAFKNSGRKTLTDMNLSVFLIKFNKIKKTGKFYKVRGFLI